MKDTSMIKKILLLPLITAGFVTPAITHCSLGIIRTAITTATGACAGFAGQKAVRVYNRTTMDDSTFLKIYKFDKKVEKIKTVITDSENKAIIIPGIATAFATDKINNSDLTKVDRYIIEEEKNPILLAKKLKKLSKENITKAIAPGLFRTIARNSFVVGAGVSAYDIYKRIMR